MLWRAIFLGDLLQRPSTQGQYLILTVTIALPRLLSAKRRYFQQKSSTFSKLLSAKKLYHWYFQQITFIKSYFHQITFSKTPLLSAKCRYFQQNGNTCLLTVWRVSGAKFCRESAHVWTCGA
jgi:hypothetical protein